MKMHRCVPFVDKHPGDALDAPRVLIELKCVARAAVGEAQPHRTHGRQGTALACNRLDVTRAADVEKTVAPESRDSGENPVPVNADDHQPANVGYFSKTAAYTCT